jgi:hypothetical protein
LRRDLGAAKYKMSTSGRNKNRKFRLEKTMWNDRLCIVIKQAAGVDNLPKPV